MKCAQCLKDAREDNPDTTEDDMSDLATVWTQDDEDKDILRFDRVIDAGYCVVHGFTDAKGVPLVKEGVNG